MTRLDGAAVLITGASGGFGQEMSRQLLASGSNLVLTDLDHDRLEATARHIEESIGGRSRVVMTIAADLSTRQGCEQLHQQVTRSLSPDVLINNAGMGMSGRIDQIPWQEWERLLQVNLVSVLRLTALFLPHMLERNTGHIVNISSIAGWAGSAGLSPYAASKFGVRGFSESLISDLEETPIKVTTVYPFFSRTPILDSPQYGEPQQKVPDDMATDPTDVVAEILRGIRTDKPEVFPDTMARRIHRLKRLSPWLLRQVARRQEKRFLTE